jgi:dihydrolipoamide dehydrogenase
MAAGPDQPAAISGGGAGKVISIDESDNESCPPMLATRRRAAQMGAHAIDIGKTIHPHPTLGESIGMAAEVAHGSCTDLPPARK